MRVAILGSGLVRGKTTGRVVFSPDGKLLAILSSITEVRLVDPHADRETDREIATLPNTGDPPCFSPDGSQLITMGEQGTFQV
jgi:hypothetical protein